MQHSPKVSIIITSYNYVEFLRECIESALAQTYPNIQVIVVDDGSTDDSATLIAKYAARVTAVLKDNGGQGSAFNAGFAASSGEIVLFLDSDDMVLPGAAEECVTLFKNSAVVKVHWPLSIIDKKGNQTGGIKEPSLPDGDFRKVVRRRGPMTEQLLPSAPTSGNAYRRQFLEQVLPMPEQSYRIGSDAYLFGLAPAFGVIRRAAKPLGLYRVHDANISRLTGFLKKVANGVRDYEHQSAILSTILRRDDPNLDISQWGEDAWWVKIHRAIGDIEKHVPAGAIFALADQDSWGSDPELLGRHRVFFNQQNGIYGGLLPHDKACIYEVERLRIGGAAYLVFTWETNWWREYYQAFFSYLAANYTCLESNSRVMIYHLRATISVLG